MLRRLRRLAPFCGPGGPPFSRRPKNEIDAACKRHDFTYGLIGVNARNRWSLRPFSRKSLMALAADARLGLDIARAGAVKILRPRWW